MADIDIVPKRRSSMWLWMVLALIVLAAILWFVVGGSAPETTIGYRAGALAAPAADVVALPAS